MKYLRTLSALLLAAALTLPASAPAIAASGSNTTSTGQTLTVTIDSPANGSRVNVPPGTATVTGTAAIGPLTETGNVLYVVDVSGSTAAPSNQDCNGDGGVSGLDNINGAGATGDTLDCEIAGVMALNGSLAGSPGAEAGLIAFASTSAIADVSPAGGAQSFTSLTADANANGQADIVDVARSLRQTAVTLFTGYSVGNGTNFDNPLASINTAFAAKAGETNIAYFLSDGVGSLSTGSGSPLQTAAAAGTVVHTYSIGGASTGCDPGDALRTIADVTGGTCTAVTDPSDLSSVLINPATITNMSVRLNGGGYVPVPLAGDNWTINLTGLLGGVWNTVDAKVTASDGTVATTSIQIYGNRAPSASAGGPYTVNEGSTVMLNGSASDPDGDALSVSWTPAAGLNDATLLTPTFTGIDDGVTGYTLSVTDPDGLSASDSTTVTVLNVAPELSAIAVSLAPQPVGTAVAMSASFTDAGIADTHTATWDFGDGNTAAGTVTQGAGSGSVTGSHTYTTPGIYTVTLTVADDDGGSDSATFQYVVVYDPDGGFVTGGGWIDSPAGAYVPDPTASGRANFGFVSKYKRGATVPTGQTEFQFKAGDLNFHSSTYEWLVVAGARAQYKGTGTINGAGDYGFMLTAIDGQRPGGGGTDRFRIKIWDRATDTVVYDNQMGEGDDAPVNTAVSGGQIVIHQ